MPIKREFSRQDQMKLGINIEAFVIEASNKTSLKAGRPTPKRGKKKTG